jgi:hypothetical protein
MMNNRLFKRWRIYQKGIDSRLHDWESFLGSQKYTTATTANQAYDADKV